MDNNPSLQLGKIKANLDDNYEISENAAKTHYFFLSVKKDVIDNAFVEKKKITSINKIQYLLTGEDFKRSLTVEGGEISMIHNPTL